MVILAINVSLCYDRKQHSNEGEIFILNSGTDKKLLLIDGNSLIYRAFYALPPLQNSRGEHTNATYGFTNMLLKLLEEEKPDFVIVAMDYPAPSFRQSIFSAYKGNREKTPEELVEQAQRIREILGIWRITVLEAEGYEADDVIGTLSVSASNQSIKTTVVTGDTDLLQLVKEESVMVLFTRKGITQMDRFGPGKLKEQYGLEPAQMIDYKALKGDPSDNIPGVPGIGDKTARKLLQEYGNIECLYTQLEKLGGKLAQNLLQHKEQLFVGRELVTLNCAVPLHFTWEQCAPKPDYSRLQELFDELDFKSLSARMRKLTSETELKGSASAAFTELVPDNAALARLLADVREGDTLALLVEPPGGRPYWRAPLPVIVISRHAEKGCYIRPDLFKPDEDALWETLAKAWSKGVCICCHDSKYLVNYLQSRGFNAPERVFDLQLAAYLLDSARSSYDLPSLFKEYLQQRVPEQTREEKHSTVEQTAARLTEWAGKLFPLQEKLQHLMSLQSLDDLYFQLELPLAGVLARMERQGMSVDLNLLKDLSAGVRSRLEILEKEICSLAGEQFNLNSPQQLSRILFSKLGLPVVRKTKTGQSTDAKVLEELAPRHEIVEKLLYYRQLTKLEGTYLSGLAPLVDQDTNKIYTTLNQTVTNTGRLSSSEPNLQNIPIRLEEGKRVRRAFVPSGENMLLLTADYSQIELRVLAHLSQDPLLSEAFRQDQDIHLRTAAEVFHLPVEEVTDAIRKKAKAVNFGIVYGISDYGLAQGTGVSRQEARKYIDSYFDRYQGVKRYRLEVIDRAREQGYVTTLLSRRRYLPELNSSNFGLRSFAERMALNTPIQGSAADIIKLAMLRIDEMIRRDGFKADMLLQIHDELIFELPEEEIHIFAPIVKREMEEALNLTVPLKVDLEWGKNWGELQPLFL